MICYFFFSRDKTLPSSSIRSATIFLVLVLGLVLVVLVLVLGLVRFLAVAVAVAVSLALATLFLFNAFLPQHVTSSSVSVKPFIFVLAK